MVLVDCMLCVHVCILGYSAYHDSTRIHSLKIAHANAHLLPPRAPSALYLTSHPPSLCVSLSLALLLVVLSYGQRSINSIPFLCNSWPNIQTKEQEIEIFAVSHSLAHSFSFSRPESLAFLLSRSCSLSILVLVCFSRSVSCARALALSVFLSFSLSILISHSFCFVSVSLLVSSRHVSLSLFLDLALSRALSLYNKHIHTSYSCCSCFTFKIVTMYHCHTV